MKRDQPLTTDIMCGFASFQDGTFDLIVQRQSDGLEVTLSGRLTRDQFEVIDQMLPTCVFVPADVRKK